MKQKITVIFIISLLLFSNVTLLVAKKTNKTNISNDFNFKDEITFSTSNGGLIYAPGELIIKFRESTKSDIFSSLKVSSFEKLIKDNSIPKFDNTYIYKFEDKEMDMLSISKEVMNDPFVEYAEPNYVLFTCNEPNDPFFSYQWALKNTGQNNGIAGADIHAIDSWDITTGESNITIAIIDTGVDYNHSDIANNIWVNPGEDINKNGIVDLSDFNGIDDDGNDFVDDIRGFDFVDINSSKYEDMGYELLDEDYKKNDSDPMDKSGHGTHCAGIVGAIGNNNFGISGVCWNSKIMPIRSGFKIRHPEGYITAGLETDAIVRAIYYATNNSADVISMSFGFYQYDWIPHPIILRAACNYSYDQGVVLVAAAGNDNGYATRHYPSAYENVISVGATNKNDEKALFSNHGPGVDIAAPGENILSLKANGTNMGNVLDDYYTFASGTSMACPHVSGLAGLILSKNKNLEPDEVKDIIILSTDRLHPSLDIGIGGRINAYRALRRKSDVSLVYIDSPNHGAEVDEIIQIKGTASGEDFQKYCLQYARFSKKYESLDWIELVDSNIKVENEVIYSLNTDVLEEGYYFIKLRVECKNGGIHEDLIWLLVNNKKNTIFADCNNNDEPFYGTEKDPYNSIQYVVDYVAGQNDLIYVLNGTYYENIEIDKPLHLVGKNKNSTIIDGNKNTSIYIYNTSNVKIKNFTIRNGYYGIHLHSLSNSVISENNLFQNRYPISTLHSSNNIIYHNNFMSNTNNVYSSQEDINTWYNELLGEGNYWDNYRDWYKKEYDEEPEDKNKDGIWDVPYDIPYGDCKDKYPWVKENGKVKSKQISNMLFNNLYAFSKILQLFTNYLSLYCNFL